MVTSFPLSRVCISLKLRKEPKRSAWTIRLAALLPSKQFLHTHHDTNEVSSQEPFHYLVLLFTTKLVHGILHAPTSLHTCRSLPVHKKSLLHWYKKNLFLFLFVVNVAVVLVLAGSSFFSVLSPVLSKSKSNYGGHQRESEKRGW